MAGKEEMNQRAAGGDGAIARMRKALLGFYNRTRSNTTSTSKGEELKRQISRPFLPSTPLPPSRSNNQGFSFESRAREIGKARVSTRPMPQLELNKPLPLSPDEARPKSTAPVGLGIYGVETSFSRPPLPQRKFLWGAQPESVHKTGMNKPLPPTPDERNKIQQHRYLTELKMSGDYRSSGDQPVPSQSPGIRRLGNHSPATTIEDRGSTVAERNAHDWQHGFTSHFSAAMVGVSEGGTSTRFSMSSDGSSLTPPSSWRDSDIRSSFDIAASLASSDDDRRSNATRNSRSTIVQEPITILGRMTNATKVITIVKAKAASASPETDISSLGVSAGGGDRTSILSTSSGQIHIGARLSLLESTSRSSTGSSPDRRSQLDERGHDNRGLE